MLESSGVLCRTSLALLAKPSLFVVDLRAIHDTPKKDGHATVLFLEGKPKTKNAFQAESNGEKYVVNTAVLLPRDVFISSVRTSIFVYFVVAVVNCGDVG